MSVEIEKHIHCPVCLAGILEYRTGNHINTGEFREEDINIFKCNNYNCGKLFKQLVKSNFNKNLGKLIEIKIEDK